MKSQLTPYRRFPGTARDAMEFYHGIFGGELEIMNFGDMHQSEEVGGETDKVMHSHILVGGSPLLFAADIIGGMEITAGEDTPISVTGGADALDEVKGYWQSLAEGGTVQMDFAPVPWGAYFGSLKDKFGTHWFFNVEA